MAKKRMFSPDIVRSDAFLDMPMSTQLLYFHLGMEADDDGFVSSANMVRRICGASEDDLKLLIAKRFLILFEGGLVLIKHWKINNYIRSDRYTPTKYVDELSTVFIKENKSYTLNAEDTHQNVLPPAETDLVYQRYTTRYTQNRLDKISIDKTSSSIDISNSIDSKEKKISDFKISLSKFFKDSIFCGDFEKGQMMADSFLAFNLTLHEDFYSWAWERIEPIARNYARIHISEY